MPHIHHHQMVIKGIAMEVRQVATLVVSHPRHCSRLGNSTLHELSNADIFN